MIKSCFSGAVLRVGTADVLKCDFYDWIGFWVLEWGFEIGVKPPSGSATADGVGCAGITDWVVCEFLKCLFQNL